LRSNPHILQKPELQEFTKWLDNKFIFDNSAIDELTVQTKIKHYKEKYQIDVVFIDYIGLMQCSVRVSTDNERLERISRAIKLTAQSNELPIIVLSQLNRDITKRTKGLPQMSDLRGSGAMEQDADIIVFPHRPPMVYTDQFGNVVENLGEEVVLIVEKHRHGATGFLKDSVKFVRHIAKFANIAIDTQNNTTNNLKSTAIQQDIDF
jgi:replicative DNA helicase